MDLISSYIITVVYNMIEEIDSVQRTWTKIAVSNFWKSARSRLVISHNYNQTCLSMSKDNTRISTAL